MDLTGKTALITGASAGLGKAFATALVAQGMHVFGTARSAERLQPIQDALGDAFTPIVGNVSDEADAQRAIDTVMEKSGRLDVLINNAGLGKFGAVDALDLAQWDEMMATNLRGVFLFTRLAVPLMKAQNVRDGFGGQIVNIASVAGLMGNPNISAYNATKFGLRGFTDAVMKEVRNHNIKVTCFYPGSIATEFFDVAGVELQGFPMQAEDLAATLVHVLTGPPSYLISEVVMRPARTA